MKKPTVLISWIGKTDIRTIQSGAVDIRELGPLRYLARALPCDVFYILASQELECHETLVMDNLRELLPSVTIVFEKTGLEDPSSYIDVYDVTERFFDKYNLTPQSANYIFNLTPGTPTTQAIMLYFSHVRYPASKTYRTLDPRYCPEGDLYREIQLPFKIPELAWQSEPAAQIDQDEQRDVLEIFAPAAEVNILLLGETGVGKSHFARQIHEASGRGKKEFVSVNCALAMGGDVTALHSTLFGHKKGAFTGAVNDRKGAFLSARGGTLFLDEIGEIPISVQATLLSAIQDREITPLGSDKAEMVRDVRIISATNRNLLEDVRKGRFREDLYSRIAMLPVTLPPLRDIAQNAPKAFEQIVREYLDRFAEKRGRKLSISPEGMRMLLQHDLPGNRRQLEHVLLLAGIVSSYKACDVIPGYLISRYLHASWPAKRIQQSVPLAERFFDIREQELPHNLEAWLKDIKDRIIDEGLRRTGNNLAKTAKLLDYPYQKLRYYKSSRETKDEAAKDRP
ncbi:MAG: sigma 54-interacting transcriptional regulator [Desulfovibrionaceae bacterium]|nr:sigma 54-interacting transcriptional regulator [Desulfovibrionaceae bacterium]